MAEIAPLILQLHPTSRKPRQIAALLLGEIGVPQGLLHETVHTATTFVLAVSNLCVSLARGLLRPEIRIPAFVLIIASAVTAVELLMRAWLHDLYLVLGIFIPLIVTNCAIIGRAEAFASKNRLMPSLVDGLAMGIGFTLVLVALGGMRELIGMGTLFSQAELMFGPAAEGLKLTLGEDFKGALIAILPPGAFIGLGLIIVLKNLIDRRLSQKKTAPAATQAEVIESTAG